MNTNEILEKLGIEMNAMQNEAYDAILHSRNDVVVLSPTGSGKTLAYLMPLVQLVDADSDEVQAVVITPGRELALQSAEVLKSMGSGLRGMACYGGRPTMDEHRVLRQVKPQIVFGTPGRLNDHLEKRNILADDIKYLVIDEFDKCLEMGFQDEMSALIDKLPNINRHFLLSATEAEEIPHFLRRDKKAKVTNISYLDSEEQVPDRIGIYQVNSPEKDKLESLKQLLLSLGDQSTIVFLNYRQSVERVDDFLRQQGFATSAFHGGLEQQEREDALYKFSNGSANVFVSTDLGSRGLDIPDIDNIIHYHIPETEDNYIHRVGRTARWDKQGRAFFLLSPGEHLPEYVDSEVRIYEIPDTTGMKPSEAKMATVYIGKGKKDKISKGDIVGFICKNANLQGKEIGKIDVKDRYSYVAVPRKKLRLVINSCKGVKIKGIRTVVEEVR
jgi:superfamily II DNA/RNA helicase